MERHGRWAAALERDAGRRAREQDLQGMGNGVPSYALHSFYTPPWAISPTAPTSTSIQQLTNTCLQPGPFSPAPDSSGPRGHFPTVPTGDSSHLCLLPVPALALLLAPISGHLQEGDSQIRQPQLPPALPLPLPGLRASLAGYAFCWLTSQPSSPPWGLCVFVSGLHCFCCLLPGLRTVGLVPSDVSRQVVLLGQGPCPATFRAGSQRVHLRSSLQNRTVKKETWALPQGTKL